jgi:hypothetical protein
MRTGDLAGMDAGNRSLSFAKNGSNMIGIMLPIGHRCPFKA